MNRIPDEGAPNQAEGTTILQWAFGATAIVCLLAFTVFCGLTRYHSGNDLAWVNWDAPIVLDGAWRSLQGQRTHVDYSSPIGPFVFELTAIGMWLGGVSIGGIDRGLALLLFAFVPLMALSLYRRCHPILLVGFVVLAGSYVVTPRMFNYTKDILGYTGVYNTVGIGLLLASYFATYLREGETRSSRILAGAVLGLTLVALLTLKITYFALAGLFVAHAFVFGKMSLQRVQGVGFGAIIGLFGFALYLGFDLGAFLRDMRVVSGARSGADVFSSGNIQRIATEYLPTLNWMLGFFLFSLVFNGRGAKHYLLATSGFLLAVFTDLFVGITIMQRPEFFMRAPYGLVVLAGAVDFVRKQDQGAWWRQTVAVVAMSYVLWPVVKGPVAANLDGIFRKYERLQPAETKKRPAPSKYISDLSVIGQYPAMYEDGMNALSRIISPEDRILTFSYPNIFSFGLKQPSPRGDLLYWHHSVTFDERVLDGFPSLFSPEVVFRDVTIIVFPKKPSKETSTLLAHYEEFFARQFEKATDATYWRVLRRRNHLATNARTPKDVGSQPSSSIE